MAGASFLAGILPLSLSLSPSQLRLISTVGMGVLVGTSLIVIIPEGVDTLYSSTSVAHAHTRRDIAPVSTGVDIVEPRAVAELSGWSARGISDDEIDPFALPGPVVPSELDMPPKTPTAPGVVGALGGAGNAREKSKHEEGAHDDAHHAWIGVALIAGFILMYLIDKVPQYTNPSKPRAKTHHIALNNLSRRFNLTTSLDRDDEADTFLETAQGSSSRSRSFATTIGLVIHAAADGIALGASSSTANSGLSFIIFFAIMVHKAPAAFGMTSVLIKQGVSKRTARAHLLIFSLAAPAGAIVTWVLAHLLGGSSGNPESSTWWTGMLLLFSAGTFLYVAMHAMQETSASHQEPYMNGHSGSMMDGRDGPSQEPKPSLKDVGAACFGMILPLFLQIGHAH